MSTINAYGLTAEEYNHLCMVVAAAELAQPHHLATAIRAVKAHFGMDCTYTCEACGTATPACLWGPGWITCPTCGKRARSAVERHGDALSSMCDQ